MIITRLGQERHRVPGARSAHLLLGAGLALCAVFLVTPDPAATILYLVVGAFGMTLSVIGALRMPPAHRRIWWAIAIGQAFFFIGDLLWTWFEEVLHVEPFPSVADVFYLLSYPALVLGALWLIRGRRSGRDRAAFLDAAILTTGCTVLASVFIISPSAEAGGSAIGDQLVAGAYPAADLLVLAVVIRLLTGGTVRNVALWAVILGFTAVLVADIGYNAAIIGGVETTYGVWIDEAYLLSYVLLGYAPLHPSARSLSEPSPEKAERITAVRLAILGAALMLAPVTGQLAHLLDVQSTTGPWVVLVGGVLSAVLVVLRLWDLIQRLQRKAVQLAALARKDALTGVANRRTWDHELSRACAFAREHDTPLTVAVLDMDHFKLFNDRYGHVRGDLVLKETATAWAAQLTGRGFVARYGGEEFAVLLPSSSTTDSASVLDRLRRSVTHDQTCSVGFAEWDGTESPAHVFARADQALYHAKREGRNRIAVHDGHGVRIAQPGTDPTEHLPTPSPVFQPIVDLQTGAIVAYEALSRFAEGAPDQVFANASRRGYGAALEALAVRTALDQWDRPEPLSINLSLTALRSPDVQEVLPEDLSGLVLELTERDLSDYSPETMLFLDALRARGASIAIDDVGVGFSNIERIVVMRPDIIKLDQTLIRGVDANPMLQAVIAGTLVFGRESGAAIVAEGVETAAERDFLAAAGVPMAQGFFLGRPVPRSELVFEPAGA